MHEKQFKKKERLISYYNKIAQRRTKWRKRNRYYHNQIKKYISLIIPQSSKVAEIGCGTGDLLSAMQPSEGLGIDFSEQMVNLAKKKYPELKIVKDDIEELKVEGKYDYIILSDLLHNLLDVQLAFKHLKKLCNPGTRIIITNYSYIWEPVLRLAELLRLKQKSPVSNWLSQYDIFKLLELEGYQVIKHEKKVIVPKYIPIISFLFNKVLVNFPIFFRMGLVNIITARKLNESVQECSASIIVPARNEKGNIENAILRTPSFGKHQEFVFVEGNSSDNTYEEMLRVQEKYKDKDIKVIKQSGKGKGNAVWEGFDLAQGEILMILDADLTTPPEDLPKFYDALVQGKGEFINGCRLVYPMEKQAMRFLNFLGNKFFGWFFSYLLGQRLKDTLCGTKVLFKTDYNKIANNRSYFGDFDPFGDFDLLFGASKLNLKITEIIVRYKDREYGETQISRFSHGWLLIKMSIFAAFKIKYK